MRTLRFGMKISGKRRPLPLMSLQEIRLGGAYTYANVPLGFWLQEVFDLNRNPYDKIGHFMQGFVPARIAREILLRGSYVADRVVG